ncbi:DNA helicase PcrA [Desulforudis sp. 1088]|uniref:DNA helicase PcrA n=1 Tax=unclassified Candidatus Desulforudis TaxID=2635950 RepID=UPI003CE4997F
MDLLDQLNPAQARAVTHPGGPLLVVAGAGSGKTRVLTCRVAYLMRHLGVPAHQILAITFTNKAAREMRERIEKLVPFAVRDIWISTFHAACLRILRRDIAALGYDRGFVIYDEGDQQTVVKSCLADLDLDPKKYPPRGMLTAISHQKNWLVDAEEYAAGADGYWEELVAQVYKRYQERLRENNALDFDDLLCMTVRLFREIPQVLEYYQERFRYILIDEYQDTNHAQYVLVNLLARRDRNLTVVGDPDQSIFGWRGADLRNIMDFERDYPEATVVKLEENYRSTGHILDAANSVIRHNLERKEKKLWTSKDRGEPLRLFKAPDEQAEARFIADRIRWLRFSGQRKYREFAVLYRTHAQSRVLEEVFLRNGIPYTIVGGLSFYERKEIKDLLAYLRVIVNPADAVSLERIINVPRRGIGKASLQKFFAFAYDAGISLGNALLRSGEIAGLSQKVSREMTELGRKIAAWREQAESGVTSIVRDVLEGTGYWQELVNEKSVEAQTRMENLAEFLSVTRQFDEAKGGSLLEFLNELALVTDLDRYNQDDDQVTLMTLHSAKGLEFPVVFLAGLEDGVFPLSRALAEPRELEEERRLCYVGITRARELLFLTCCQSRWLYGNVHYNQPSRFLLEIPPELVAQEGEAAPVGAETKPTGPADTVSFCDGDRVRHQKWGEGVVVQVVGEGSDMQLKVAFPKQGIKTLLVAYAPLEKLNPGGLSSSYRKGTL